MKVYMLMCFFTMVIMRQALGWPVQFDVDKLESDSKQDFLQNQGDNRRDYSQFRNLRTFGYVPAYGYGGVGGGIGGGINAGISAGLSGGIGAGVGGYGGVGAGYPHGYNG